MGLQNNPKNLIIAPNRFLRYASIIDLVFEESPALVWNSVFLMLLLLLHSVFTWARWHINLGSSCQSVLSGIAIHIFATPGVATGSR